MTDTLETGVRTLQAVGAAADEQLAQLLLLGQQAQQAVRDLGVHVQAPVGDQAEALQLLVQLQAMRALQEPGLVHCSPLLASTRFALPIALNACDCASLASKHRRPTQTQASSTVLTPPKASSRWRQSDQTVTTLHKMGAWSGLTWSTWKQNSRLRLSSEQPMTTSSSVSGSSPSGRSSQCVMLEEALSFAVYFVSVAGRGPVYLPGHDRQPVSGRR